jgi:HPP family
MKKKKSELLIAPIGEGGLLLIAGAIGWGTHQPFIFASLGPTIYEIIEQPQQKSARTYNVIAGHFVAIGAGYFALWVLNAWNSPGVASAKFVSLPRLWAGVIAVVLTTLLTLLIGASQPASLSTTLLVSLGVMQTARDAGALAAGVLIIAIAGEPLRLLRLKQSKQNSPPASSQ